MRLDEGWNQIQFNLADFTRRAYPLSKPNSIHIPRIVFNTITLASFSYKLKIKTYTSEAFSNKSETKT